MFEVNVRGSVVSVQKREPLIAGAASAYTVHFTFDQRWEGLTRTATFRVGTVKVSMALDREDRCTLPWEVTQRKYTGYEVYVEVCGIGAGAEVYPTGRDSLGAVRPSGSPGGYGEDPTPSVYEQFVRETKEYSDRAVAGAEASADSAARSAASAGQAEEAAKRAAGDADLAAHWATEAEEAASNAAKQAQEAAEEATERAEAAVSNANAALDAAEASQLAAQAAAEEAQRALASAEAAAAGVTASEEAAAASEVSAQRWAEAAEASALEASASAQATAAAASDAAAKATEAAASSQAAATARTAAETAQAGASSAAAAASASEQAARASEEGAATSAETAAALASNPNLLDNWYFADPVDSRQGHVVPPDTPYYSDSGLTTQAGTVSAYTTAVKVNDTYGTIAVGGVTYYLDWTAAVRGYAGSGYTADRWRSASKPYVLMTDSGVQLAPSGYWMQDLDPKMIAHLRGKTLTLSALTTAGAAHVTFTMPTESPVDTAQCYLPGIGHALDICTVYGADRVRIYPSGTPTEGVSLIAAKLELGDRQTLARQDGEGNWVLNDPPNKPLQLALCSQYDPYTGAFHDTLLAAKTVVEFQADGWTVTADGAELRIPAASHGVTGDLFGYTVRQAGDSSTWAALGTRAYYDGATGELVLQAEEAYAGSVTLNQ